MSGLRYRLASKVISRGPAVRLRLSLENLKDIVNCYCKGSASAVTSESIFSKRHRINQKSLDRVTRSRSCGTLFKLLVKKTVLPGEKQPNVKIVLV